MGGPSLSPSPPSRLTYTLWRSHHPGRTGIKFNCLAMAFGRVRNREQLFHAVGWFASSGGDVTSRLLVVYSSAQQREGGGGRGRGRGRGRRGEENTCEKRAADCTLQMQIRERPRLEGVAADVEKGFLRPWGIHRTLLLRVLCYDNAQSGEEKKKSFSISFFENPFYALTLSRSHDRPRWLRCCTLSQSGILIKFQYCRCSSRTMRIVSCQPSKVVIVPTYKRRRRGCCGTRLLKNGFYLRTEPVLISCSLLGSRCLTSWKIILAKWHGYHTVQMQTL